MNKQQRVSNRTEEKRYRCTEQPHFSWCSEKLETRHLLLRTPVAGIPSTIYYYYYLSIRRRQLIESLSGQQQKSIFASYHINIRNEKQRKSQTAKKKIIAAHAAPTHHMMLSMRSSAVTARRVVLLLPTRTPAAAAVASAANAATNTTTAAAAANSIIMTRHFSTDAPPAASRKSLVTAEEGVHQTMKISKSWRNKPLFRRQGDVRFRTGTEASQLLINEANRRDQHLKEFIAVISSTMMCLSPIFERNPKYAFVAKTLMEPDRFVQFRVAWIDDTGVIRMNRGFRIQYSSSLGPYSGSLHFGSHVTNSLVKTLGFAQVFSNALTGFDNLGAAVGGSDFNPLDKSEGELQRFCQSYITELAKYIGPDQDLPWMGMGVGKEEMAYMFGQYKRISAVGCPSGRQFLSPDYHWVCIFCFL
jgi:Glu/Leu/Phe/Val dehydrogenase, dimerisation domain